MSPSVNTAASRWAWAVLSGSPWYSKSMPEEVLDPDRAGLARGQLVAVVVEDVHLVDGARATHRPRPRQPLLARGQADHPALGGAVVLVDHRAPPLDHPPLGLGRAGRGAVPHDLQGAAVEGAPDLVGQLQQADHLRRHEVDVGHAVGVDDPQRLGGVEPVAHHHAGALQQREHAEGPLGRVVHRAVQVGQAPDRRVHRLAEAVPVHPEEVDRQGGVEHAVAHALGPAGGARRVEHRAAQGLVGRLGVGGLGQHALVGQEALDRRRRRRCGWRRAARRGRRPPRRRAHPPPGAPWHRSCPARRPPRRPPSASSPGRSARPCDRWPGRPRSTPAGCATAWRRCRPARRRRRGGR